MNIIKNTIYILLMLVCASAMAEKPLLIGILEEPACKRDGQRALRPLFTKKDTEWVALDNKVIAASYKMERVVWTAAFDGKNLGQVISHDPKINITPDWTYPRDYLHNLDTEKLLPQIMNKAGAFSAWCGGLPKYFPIVMVSKPYYSDPEKWKRSQPDSDDRKLLFSAFQKSFRSLCVIKSKKTTPYLVAPYKSGDLHILDFYKSTNDHKVASVSIGEGYYECDKADSPSHGDDNRRVFYVGEGARYLGSDLTLVDAGDYDNDGKSEVLFWYDAYNRNGYVLFYDGFSKRADFIWGYH